MLVEIAGELAADWLRAHFWLVGDFLAWRWASLTMLAVLVIVGAFLVVGDCRRSKGIAQKDKVDEELAAPAPAPKRTGIRMKGGKGWFKGTKVREVDVAVDTEDTEVEMEDTDIG